MKITPLHIQTANRWRMQYNPLRGLTLNRAVCLLEEGELGRYADLQWLFRFIEKRDETLRSLVRRRSSALSKLNWEIKSVPEDELPEGASKGMAEAQQKFLSEVYNGIDNLKEAIRFLALAEFRGFAHLEKHINPDGDIFHLEPVWQWHWCRDGLYGEWQYNADAANSAKGTPIDYENFIIREVSDPIDEPGLIRFIRKNLGDKDWDGFIESYGIPPLFIVGPPNVPKEKEKEFQAVAEQVASDARGYLPNGSDVKTAAAGERGTNPFKEHLQHQIEQMVLAGTGGKLTMLNEPTGIGGSQGEVHDDAFDDLATEEAQTISEIFQRQFDAGLLEAKFPGQPVLAYFLIERDTEDEETRKFKQEVWKGFLQDGTVNDILANLTNLKELTEDVGLPVEEDYIDPFVPVLTEQGAPVTGDLLKDAAGDIIGAVPGEAPQSSQNLTDRTNRTDAAQFQNRAPGDAVPEFTMDEVAQGFAADFVVIRNWLSEIRSVQDPALLAAKLRSFQAEIPQLIKDMNAAPSAAPALARLIKEEMLKGFQEGAPHA